MNTPRGPSRSLEWAMLDLDPLPRLLGRAIVVNRSGVEATMSSRFRCRAGEWQADFE